jgi:hypothetical protein
MNPSSTSTTSTTSTTTTIILTPSNVKDLQEYKQQAAIHWQCELELTALMKEQAKLYDDYIQAKEVIKQKQQFTQQKLLQAQQTIAQIIQHEASLCSTQQQYF